MEQDNKLIRTRKPGYKRITEKEVKEVEEKKEMFSYDDFAKDDFYMPSCDKFKTYTKGATKGLIITINEKI